MVITLEDAAPAEWRPFGRVSGARALARRPNWFRSAASADRWAPAKNLLDEEPASCLCVNSMRAETSTPPIDQVAQARRARPHLPANGRAHLKEARPAARQPGRPISCHLGPAACV